MYIWRNRKSKYFKNETRGNKKKEIIYKSRIEINRIAQGWKGHLWIQSHAIYVRAHDRYECAEKKRETNG